MHSIPVMLKPVYGVGSPATLKGGYNSAYEGKHMANANTNT